MDDCYLGEKYYPDSGETGEPLSRDDFRKISLTTKELFIKLGLMINCTLILENNVGFLYNNFNSINISIDGYVYIINTDWNLKL